MGRVCILLATYQGGTFLQAQLDSLAAQIHRDWQLVVSDDGSTDETHSILGQFTAEMAATGRQVTVQDGPRTGGAANFLTLLGQAPDADWVALSDQDDIWLEHRLTQGIAALQDLPADRPALYCSATIVTDIDLSNERPSRHQPKPPGFRNALLQNIAAGNTILLNRAAMRIIRDLAPGAAKIHGTAVHDWWLYQIVTGAGGQVIYDPRPTLYYRQHGKNEVGANEGLAAALFRFRFMLAGRLHRWTEANLKALALAEPYLTPENRQLVAEFAALRKRWLLPRLWRFSRLGLYRQSRLAQATMWVALALGKL